MSEPVKRCRSKSTPAQAMKSPDPKKLRRAAKTLQKKGPASATTSSPDSILKNPNRTSKEALARKLSFGSSMTHDIEAENAPPGSSSEAAFGVL